MSLSILPTASAHGTRNDDQPTHRRFFLGPMPDKILSKTEAQVKKKKKRGWFTRSAPEGKDAHNVSLSAIIQDHAFEFFLREGGHEEDWGEHQERSMREEMLRRWGDSEWGHVWRRRHSEDRARASRWVGGSFEIGHFLGVNILDEERASSSRYSASSRRLGSSIRPSFSTRPSTARTPSNITSLILKPAPASTTAEETFVTAHSNIDPSVSENTIPLPSTTHGQGGSLLPPTSNSHDPDSRPISASSTTALILPQADQPMPLPKARSEVIRRPILRSSTSDGLANGTAINISKRSALIPGRSKTVHYMDSPTREHPPAPPGEVLARTGSAVEDTSAGAVENSSTQEDDLVWGNVVMRGECFYYNLNQTSFLYPYRYQTECLFGFVTANRITLAKLSTRNKIERLITCVTRKVLSSWSSGARIVLKYTKTTYVSFGSVQCIWYNCVTESPLERVDSGT